MPSETRSSCRTSAGAPDDRRFGNDDPVECPDGVEVERLGKPGKLFELLDGHLVSKVWQVQSELHERTASSPFVSGSLRPTLRSSGSSSAEYQRVDMQV